MLMLVGEWSGVCRGRVVRGPDDLGDELAETFGLLPQEALFALSLDGSSEVLDCSLVALGTANCARASPRDVFRRAVQIDACSLVLGHNHPSGRMAPSPADLALTARMIKSGELLDVELTDHLIVTRHGWLSLRESTSMWTDRRSRASAHNQFSVDRHT